MKKPRKWPEKKGRKESRECIAEKEEMQVRVVEAWEEANEEGEKGREVWRISVQVKGERV